jgi:hypothetical protein
MMKQAALMVAATLLVVACGRNDTVSSPSQVPKNSPSTSGDVGSAAAAGRAIPFAAQGQRRVGFGVNGTVSGFPTGRVFLSGGGAYQLDSHFANAAGGFTCINAVRQGPLSNSINPNDPGPCLDGEGIRWDTAALLDGTTFKCTASATDETATTGDTTVVLQADFYRTGDGNDESFTGKMIVSNGDISKNFPGVNVWVQGVGCGTAQAVNFSN